MPPSSDDIADLMASHSFFGGLTDAERHGLIDRSEVESVSAGSILFHHGDAYRGFYLILEGAVHIYRLSPEGRMLVLHVMRPGETFAEVPLFEEQYDTYPATAETLEDSTLLFVPGDVFVSFVEENPRIALRMLGQMAGRLRKAIRQLDAVSLHDVQERLARHLVEQVPAAPDNPNTPPTVELDIPKSVLAAELGTVPETLSRALRALEDENLIRSEASTIALTDVRGLRHMVRSN